MFNTGSSTALNAELTRRLPDSGVEDNGFFISFSNDEFFAESGMDGGWHETPGPRITYLNASEMRLLAWWKGTAQSYRQRDASVLWSAVEENDAAAVAGFLRAGYPVNQRYEYPCPGDDSILPPALANKNKAMIRLLAGYGLRVSPELLPALYELDMELWATLLYRAVKNENASALELITGNRRE